MSALEEAAEIVSRKWKSGDKWLKILLGIVIGAGLLFLAGWLFSKLIRLLMPARTNIRRLYLPRMGRG